MHLLKRKDNQNSQITDQEIVQRILSGEKVLYELLLRRYNQKLFRVVRSYISDEQEVEEVIQQTYIKAYEKLFQFQWNSGFSTWLIRIGINQALEQLREKTKHIKKYASLSDHRQEVFQIADNYQMTPESRIIQTETKHLLEKAVDMLPEKYRVIYVFKEVEGMSISEICGCLDLSESNVKVRAHRAKQMLKENLYAISEDQEIFEFGNERCDRLVDRVMKAIL